MLKILPLIVLGLAMFIFSIIRLSIVLKRIFSVRAKNTILKYTSNIFLSISIGAILTIALGSSSAVIILAIVFINAKTLTFKNAIGIIMGANIGTTVSSQIFALDIGKYSIFLFGLGLLGTFIFERNLYKNYARALLFFGMLFLGLYVIEQSVFPLKDYDLFNEWIANIEDKYIFGTLIGGLITLIIQSSSATVGMAIVLAKQNILNLAGGIAIMLGAELGTCADTLVATIKGSRQAIKAGVFHLFFNFTTIVIGLIIFLPFVNFVSFISPSDAVDKQIANAHVIFNIAGVLLFLPFVSLAEKFLNYLIPDKKLVA